MVCAVRVTGGFGRSCRLEQLSVSVHGALVDPFEAEHEAPKQIAKLPEGQRHDVIRTQLSYQLRQLGHSLSCVTVARAAQARGKQRGCPS